MCRAFLTWTFFVQALWEFSCLVKACEGGELPSSAALEIRAFFWQLLYVRDCVYMFVCLRTIQKASLVIQRKWFSLFIS